MEGRLLSDLETHVPYPARPSWKELFLSEPVSVLLQEPKSVYHTSVTLSRPFPPQLLAITHFSPQTVGQKQIKSTALPPSRPGESEVIGQTRTWPFCPAERPTHAAEETFDQSDYFLSLIGFTSLNRMNCLLFCQCGDTA